MLTLIKEDGTGGVDANTYALVADGDAYHEGHTHAAAWTSATPAQKEVALVCATRLIDACYQFRGFKTTSAQALQWPRTQAHDDDRGADRVSPLLNGGERCWGANEMPPILVQATCEQARAMLAATDRTADPDGEGIKQMALVGALSVTFDARDRRPMITHLAQRMLSKLGQLISPRQGTVRLVRT